MKLLDANLLLYAVNRDSPHHEGAKSWLERIMAGEELVGLPWVVILAFVRIATSRRVFPEPLSPDAALAAVDGWLSRPQVVIVNPGDGHWRLLRNLLADAGTAGNLTTDAHLAAIAVEHGAELHSTDADFARFARLRWVNPLAG